MQTAKTETRQQPDLLSRYNPVGIRAVVAAALQIKARPLPAR